MTSPPFAIASPVWAMASSMCASTLRNSGTYLYLFYIINLWHFLAFTCTRMPKKVFDSAGILISLSSDTTLPLSWIFPAKLFPPMRPSKSTSPAQTHSQSQWKEAMDRRCSIHPSVWEKKKSFLLLQSQKIHRKSLIEDRRIFLEIIALQVVLSSRISSSRSPLFFRQIRCTDGERTFISHSRWAKEGKSHFDQNVKIINYYCNYYSWVDHCRCIFSNHFLRVTADLNKLHW